MKLLADQPDRKVPAEQPARQRQVKSRRLAGVGVVGAILLLALVVSIVLTAVS